MNITGLVIYILYMLQPVPHSDLIFIEDVAPEVLLEVKFNAEASMNSEIHVHSEYVNNPYTVHCMVCEESWEHACKGENQWNQHIKRSKNKSPHFR